MTSPRRRRAQEKRRRQATAKRVAAQEFPDRRSTFAEVLAQNDIPVEEKTFAVVVEPIRLDDGKELFFQSPHVPPFYLLTAKAYRDRAEPKRLRAITNTVVTPEKSLRPKNPADAFDAIEGLAIAVMLAAAAIEAHSNDMIRRLPDDSTLTIERRGITVVYEKDSMERNLNLAEKVTLVGPLLTGRASIKGTKPWEAYRRVTSLRNDLLHVKPRAENDPDDPGPFGLLLLGKGSAAPEDAAAVIDAIEPDWIPKHVRADLGLD